MPEFSNDPDLKEDIEVMQSQLQRCKTIVSGILLTAGETRGEYSAKTTLIAFVNDLEKEWRTTRQINDFIYENHVQEDLAVVFDNAIKQMLYNVLDNALEASPQWLKLNARVEDASLVFTVNDRGSGFTEAMLSSYGKPYQSTKGRPGGGLGLFLAVNVARTLGGTLAIQNCKEGGAEVTIRLPLASLALEGGKKNAD
jgi:two-component system sensor histidine kinase RegB